jgi:hypothetical protein
LSLIVIIGDRSKDFCFRLSSSGISGGDPGATSVAVFFENYGIHLLEPFRISKREQFVNLPARRDRLDGRDSGCQEYRMDGFGLRPRFRRLPFS